MAGHSKFKNIMHRKGAQDKKRAKEFSRLGREISVAVKTGGDDPDSNIRLRSAIASAKGMNMPKDNIERAIDKSTISENSSFENLRYEGFGPNKTAVIVETLTDNKNRTASNIRTIFQKSGGGLGTQGSASHNFQQLGVIKINKDEIDEAGMFDLAIESGANECFSHENFHEVHTANTEIYEVKNKLEKKIENFLSTEIEWVPLNTVNLSGENKDNMIKFLETLDDDEDVQNIFTNAKFEN